MHMLGLELSDAGIMVAGGTPSQLLEVDGPDKASPGFALPEENCLLVGKAAQNNARLNPRLYTDRFWDELDTELLKQPGLEEKNNAELAYAHLKRIWDTVKRQGDELLIAFPGFFKEKQLGLILGIAKELSIPIRGFATTALASSSNAYPNHLLLHLDIHLHRLEITLLEQGRHLTQKNPETLPGRGLSYLYAEWTKAVADEFVRHTRFDPFDQALYEQQLYNRLPLVLRELQNKPSVMFEMSAVSQMYRVNLTYDLFVQKSKRMYQEVRKCIEGMRKKFGTPEMPMVLEVTHRVSSLPGYRQELSTIPNIRIVELGPGSGAFGVLQLQDLFASQKTEKGAAFVTSRPLQTNHTYRSTSALPSSQNFMRPTHVRYGHLAYPVSTIPLVIGRGLAEDVGICIPDHIQGVSDMHCTIRISGDDVLLVDHSTHGTFVDGDRISGTTVLKAGQIIRVGERGEELQLIACVESNET